MRKRNDLTWLTGAGKVEFGSAVCFGIVNVTSDSMFEGARSGTPEQAISDGEVLLEQGFDRLDIGAVAARSGPPVGTDAEIASLTPVIEEFSRRGIQVSADTFSAEVAGRAIESGATIINDISGGSPEMFECLSGRETGYVLMHIEGAPRRDRGPRQYEDPIDHLKAWFYERIETAVGHGMVAEQIVLDPGLDFDLSVDDNLKILGRLSEFKALDRPIYLSLSRKDFLGAIAAGSWEERLSAAEREPETIAATAIGATNGANIHRLHDQSSLRAVSMVERVRALVV